MAYWHYTKPLLAQITLGAEETKKVRSFLEGCERMSKNPDWDESDAQQLVMDGAELYKEIFINKNK
jgi:hypothetical protein